MKKFTMIFLILVSGLALTACSQESKSKTERQEIKDDVNFLVGTWETDFKLPSTDQERLVLGRMNLLDTNEKKVSNQQFKYTFDSLDSNDKGYISSEWIKNIDQYRPELSKDSEGFRNVLQIKNNYERDWIKYKIIDENHIEIRQIDPSLKNKDVKISLVRIKE